MKRARDLPRGVWALGFVSLFMDVSSEMIHALLPVFLVSVVGASTTAIGLIEGLGEGLALVTRVFSGAISDWLGKRKLLAVAGYFLGALSKLLFALSANVELVLAARAADRFGKGLRGAPRDALLADITPTEVRGAAYGLRQSLDSIGAFLGPLLAILLMRATADNFRAVFWFAALPGLLAVSVLVLAVRETGGGAPRPTGAPLQRARLARLGNPYWFVLATGVLFTLARFSEAFLLLRAQNLGLADHLVPLILMTLSLCFALGAYPAGRLSDRLGRATLLSGGLLLLVLADLTLALAGSVVWVVLGAALWGLHMALTQGIFASLVADTAQPENRGTAFGLFGLATGMAVFIASLVAGWLWELFGPRATFLTGAVFAILALLSFLLLRGKLAADGERRATGA